MTLVDGQRQSIDQQGEDVGWLKSGEATLEEGLDGNCLSVEKMLAEKGLRQNKTADREEEKNSTTATINQ